MARQISQDWELVYGHPIYYLETFIDPERFRGTCYRAANWTVLGRTTGRGKDDQTHRPNRSIKEVLGLPVTLRFRMATCAPPVQDYSLERYISAVAVCNDEVLRRRI
jgi:hypothetical protein